MNETKEHDRVMVGTFYNPHLGQDLLNPQVALDHLAMADPPRADDPYFEPIKEKYELLLHDYLGQLSEPLGPKNIERAIELAELYDSPWVAEHFQCLHTEDGSYSLNYVFPPLYTEDFLERFVKNALELKSVVQRPLVMENIPGFFKVKTSQISETEWLRRFFDATQCGFLLDIPHVWLEAHYAGRDPSQLLDEFPLDYVVEVHIAGVKEDRDLRGPWISPAEPDEQMLNLMAYAVQKCPDVKAVTFDAFSPSLRAETMFKTIERIRSALE